MVARVIIAALAITVGSATLLVAYLEFYEHAAIADAREHLSWGRIEQAHTVLSGAVKLIPGSSRLRQERSKTFSAIGRWRNNPAATENAQIEMTLAVALNPLDGFAWGDYGALLIQNGRPASAIAATHRGLERDPNNLFLLGILGQAQQAAGMPEEAITTFERAQSIRQTHEIGVLLERARLALLKREAH